MFVNGLFATFCTHPVNGRTLTEVSSLSLSDVIVRRR